MTETYAPLNGQIMKNACKGPSGFTMAATDSSLSQPTIRLAYPM